MTPDLVIRRARPEDAGALRTLAELDSTEPPAGDVLVAEVDGSPWAWIELASGRTAGDPFKRTAGVVQVLEIGPLQSDGGRRTAHSC